MGLLDVVACGSKGLALTEKAPSSPVPYVPTLPLVRTLSDNCKIKILKKTIINIQ